MADSIAQISQNHPDFDIASQSNNLLGDARVPNSESTITRQKRGHKKHKGTIPLLETAKGTEIISLMENVNRDFLTGLYNRRYFTKALVEANLVEEDKEFAIIIVDVDHFKSINDTYGHTNGDVVLYELGRKLNEGFRSIDVVASTEETGDVTVARYGGEEFAIIFRNISNSASFMQRIERFRESVERDVVRTKKDSIRFTASFGVAFGSRTDDPAVVFEQADTALYFSKNKGRNIVTAYETGMEKKD